MDVSTELERHAVKRLASERTIWLTTIGNKTGSPVPSVVWFHWTGSEVLTLSRPDKPKLRNIDHNHRVTLNLEAGPGGGDVVIFPAEATYDREGPTDEEWAEYADKYSADIRGIGYAGPEAFRRDYSELVRITPKRVRGYSD